MRFDFENSEDTCHSDYNTQCDMYTDSEGANPLNFSTESPNLANILAFKVLVVRSSTHLQLTNCDRMTRVTVVKSPSNYPQMLCAHSS
jgi:hypothetical protein